jgi:hypothetical protein
MKSKQEIFFSYAWGDENEEGESREKIVNELYQALLEANYQVVRDKYDLGYKGFISDFIRSIGEGKCIVIAISRKYVKSQYCMYELYEIARNSNFDKHLFRKKVLPIMVEFVDFTNPSILEKHFCYWENEYNIWQGLFKKRVGQLSIEQMDNFHKIKLIHQNFGKLMQWIADMNTFNLMILSKDNFAEIKKEIDSMLVDVPHNKKSKQASEMTTNNINKNHESTGTRYNINNNGASIGQQNIDSDVHNSDANFNIN